MIQLSQVRKLVLSNAPAGHDRGSQPFLWLVAEDANHSRRAFRYATLGNRRNVAYLKARPIHTPNTFPAIGMAGYPYLMPMASSNDK